MKRPTLEDIKIYIKENSKCELLSTEYKNSNEKLLLRCSCGREFEVAFKHFKFSNQRQCKICGYTNGGIKNSNSHENFVSKVREKLGEDYEVLGQYKNNRTKIKMLHKTCNKEYFQSPDKILQGQRCSHCYSSKKRTLDDVREEVSIICKDKFSVVGYNGTDRVILQCKCGNILTRPMTEIRKNKGAFCNACKSSTGIRAIESFLVKNNIDFIKEYRFEDCKYKKMLPFDFYLPKHNILIEFDGEHHYRPLKHWGGEKRFKETQLRDSIKNEFCKSRNIKLIRISFKQENKIEEILKENKLTSC